MNRTKWFAPLVMAVVGVAGTAQAGLLPTGVTVLPEGSNFRWQYAIVLPTDSMLNNGDYFTIYDFNGYVPGSEMAPSGDWVFTTQGVGPTPPNVLPVDDPSKPNLSWKYIGPTVNAGQTGLGNFWATSSYQDRVESFFTARTARTSDGKPDSNITYTDVPVPGGGSEVPEPATLLLAGLGLPLLGLARLRKKKME